MYNKINTSFESLVNESFKKHIYYIIDTYHANGYECWLVGGPVRDLFLGITPKDFDFATNCPLEVTKSLFNNVIPTGEDHGTLTIHIDGENYEVTRYRKDVDTDGRRATITFASTIEEDLLRRDLTINSIAYNPLNNAIIDTNSGINDITNKVLRFVGCAETRIKEDNLRFIRMIRFKIRFGFDIDSETLEIAKNAFDASTLSMERIYDEFNKIFLLKPSNLEYDFLYNNLANKLDIDFLFHNNETSNKIIRDIIELGNLYPFVYYNGYIPDLKLPGYFKQLNNTLNFINAWGKNINDIDLKKILNHTRKNLNLAKDVLYIHGYYSKFDSSELILKLENIYNSGVPISISDLYITGHDLINVGVVDQKRGTVLNDLLDYIHEYPEHNNNAILVDRVIKKYK